MQPSKIFDILNLAKNVRANGDVFNPLFVGAPGLGKSQIVQQWAKQNNYPFIDLRIAYMEAPDLIGFPSITNKDGRQITVHNIPEFLPHEGHGVLLLEEPNRGTTSVMNCLMQVLTDRKIHKYTLPKDWIIVGCINPETAEHDVNTMDAALKDRFEIFPITYDKRSFLDYMKSANWDESLFNFVESGMWNYRLPEEITSSTPGNKYISPRTLSKLNSVLRAGVSGDMELEIYSNILGNNVGKDFYQFKHDEAPVMMNDLEKSLKKALTKLKKFSDPNNYKNGMISLTVKDIVKVNTITDDTLAEVVKVIPVEQSTALIMELEMARKDETILTRLAANYPEIKDILKSVIKYGKTK